MASAVFSTPSGIAAITADMSAITSAAGRNAPVASRTSTPMRLNRSVATLLPRDAESMFCDSLRSPVPSVSRDTPDRSAAYFSAESCSIGTPNFWAAFDMSSARFSWLRIPAAIPTPAIDITAPIFCRVLPIFLALLANPASPLCACFSPDVKAADSSDRTARRAPTTALISSRPFWRCNDGWQPQPPSTASCSKALLPAPA